MGEPIFVETWEVVGNSKGNILDIAYTRTFYPTPEAIEILRETIAEEHHCQLKRLLQTRKIEL